ncbi:MAG: DUF2007 domain-containing protein [Deltaproteobacteria bacterium]|nr:DUF2007 domain-containing protein [Deltaproteobacteria bacterium]
MGNTLEVIARYENVHEAELTRGLLESAGITAFVQDAHTVGVNWMLSNAIGGVKVAVRPEDAARAKEILGEIATSDDSDAGWGACPNCGSRKLELRSERRMTNLTWLLLGIPLLFPRQRYYCTSCCQMTDAPKE